MIGVVELVLCAVVLVVLMVIVALVVLWLGRRGNTAIRMGAAPRETPLDILKARYARGEITLEQFEQMRKDLES